MKYVETPELKELNQLIKELMDLYYETALKSGLSDSAFDILYAMVSMGNGCQQKDIADYYHMSRTTINSSLKKLEEQGYIAMQKGQGRNKHLFLTEQGESLIQSKIIPVMKMEDSIFTHMKPEDSKEFLRLFKEYIRIYRERILFENETLR